MKKLTLHVLWSSFALVLGGAVSAQAQNAPTTPTIITNANPWTGSVAAGLTLTRGNSRTLLATANADAQRKWDANELLFGADGVYGKDQDVKTAESLHGFSQFNRSVTKRLYYGVKFDALTDEIADINYRLTLAPLAGYYLIKTTNNTLAVEAGPAGVLQKLGPTTRGYATLRLGERYEHNFNPHAKLWQSFEILPEVDRFNNYYADAEIGIETALTKKTSLRTYLQDTYYNIPAPGRQKNDAKLVAAIAYKF
jgi:putative salt-induced outer membrane protein YdiY